MSEFAMTTILPTVKFADTRSVEKRYMLGSGTRIAEDREAARAHSGHQQAMARKHRHPATDSRQSYSMRYTFSHSDQ
jgi:hypothetical protein